MSEIPLWLGYIRQVPN